jgi:nudix-type nucleoside diphosphatase (YffH/AdpP family)
MGIQKVVVNMDVKRSTSRDDVRILQQSVPFQDFLSVQKTVLSHALFNGGHSAPVTRLAVMSGDAVTVLPWDPIRQRVLLVEQFRAGPMARGDAQPWSLEAIAGRIDTGEQPEDAAKREAHEEAGLTLNALHKIAGYYPSPGILAEYITSFVAICDLPDGIAGVFGQPDEAEDIRTHLVSLDDLMTLVQTGQVANAPLILSAFWLFQNRNTL